MALTFRRFGRFMRLAAAVGLATASASGVVPAQDPKPPTTPAPAPAKPDDPKAKALLEQVAKAYQTLESYSDQGEFVMAAKIGEKIENQTQPLKLTMVRPNKLDFDAGPVRLVSDGKMITTAIAPLKKFTTAKAPEKLDVETFREGPTGAVLFGGPSGVPMYILVNLLTNDEPLKALEQLGGSLLLDPADASGHTLLVDQVDGPDLRLGVDPASKLLKSVDLVLDPKQLDESAKAGRPVKIDRLGWNAGTVSTKVAKDRAFAFEAPEGFEKVDSFQQPGDGPNESFAVEGLIGKPAPDFTLTVLDGPGKTRTVKKADLAGKVVVVDFWATWCGPCLMELPEIQKLVESLEKDQKNAYVVALSQDRDPKELSEVRKLVEDTLKEKEIKLGSGRGLIGLDPSNTVGEAFQVEGLPTLVVLDGKGVVQAAHVGYSPDIREKLAAEIDTLLSGKPLARPEKDKPAEAAKK